MHSHRVLTLQFPQPIVAFTSRCGVCSRTGFALGGSGIFFRGGKGTASTGRRWPLTPASSLCTATLEVRSSRSSRSRPFILWLYSVTTRWYSRTSPSSRWMWLRSSVCSLSSSSSISFICSSSSPTLAALRSRNARCAARFWAFRFVGGVSVAGFLPGFGRGGTTHSLCVKSDKGPEDCSCNGGES